MEKPPGALEGQSTDTLDFKIAAFFPLKLSPQGLGTSRDEEDGLATMPLAMKFSFTKAGAVFLLALRGTYSGRSQA